MPIITIKPISTGHASVKPNFIFIDTNDTVAEVQATGYLNKAVKEGIAISDRDMALILTKATANAVESATYLLSVEKSGENYSLVDRQSGGSTSAIINAVDDLAALQAIDTSIFLNDKVIAVTDLKSFYILDLSSSESVSGNDIVAPTVGTGRWFKIANRLNDFSIIDTSSSTTAYTGNIDEKFTSYIDGMRVYFKADQTNTAASTLAIQGLAAKKILHPDTSEVVAGEIPRLTYVHLVYNASADSSAGAFEIVTQVLSKSQKYLTFEATDVLSADFSLGTLTDGLLKQTVVAGVSTPATAVSYVDYVKAEAPTTAGTTTAYTVTVDNGGTTLSAYAQGTPLTVMINAANTSAAGTTIDVNGLGAQAIKLQDGTDPAIGDLGLNKIAMMWHDGTNFQLINPVVSGGASDAPADATYLVQTADAALTNAQAMGALATGIVKNTTTTGVQSIAVDGTDYFAPGSAIDMASQNITSINYIELDAISSPTHGEGILFYNTTEKTPAFYNDESEVTLNIGQESWVRVRNETGGTISNGEVVYISGAEGGGENRPLISKAQADALASSQVLGVATHDIETASYGWVTRFGLVNDLNTASFNAGDVVYLDSATAGALTTTAPSSPDYSVFLGVVSISNASTGQIVLFPSNEAVSSSGGGAGSATQLTLTVRKDSAGTINAGEAVRVTGYNVGNDAVLVELADATDSSTMPAIGIAQSTFTNSSNGTAIVSGRLASVIDTSLLSEGDILYVSETAGAVTTTKPTGTALIQNIGTVVRSSASNGVVEVGGSGRTNDLPNIANTKIWIGDASGVPQEFALSGVITMTAGGVTSFNGTPVDLTADVTGILPVANGGTGASSFTDGGILLGSGSGAITAMGALADTAFVIGDGTTDPGAFVLSGDVTCTNGGVVTIAAGAVELDSMVTNTLPVANGGTGATTLTDGGVLLGSGTGAITAMGALADAALIIGDGTTDPGSAAMSGDATMTNAGVVTVSGSVSKARAINQVAHGFTTSLPTPVRWNGTIWTKAQADSAANSETQYVAIASGVDDFDLYTAGMYMSGFTAQTANTIYFIDPSTAGVITATEPSTTGQVSKPIIETITTTTAYVLAYRGEIIP